MPQHLSLDLGSAINARLARRAELAQTKRRALARRYIDEGLRRDDHPQIAFRDGGDGRRAVLLGSQLEVAEVISSLAAHRSDLGATAAYLGLAEESLEAAVIYYGEFRQEIDAEIDARQAN